MIPHLVLALLLAWRWGVWHAGLFAAYSLAAASVYLALELRLIEGAPFTRQMDATRLALGFAVIVGGGALGAAACLAAARSIDAFAVSIRHNLGLMSGETGPIYKEINA